jgi:hypothetical protein
MSANAVAPHREFTSMAAGIEAKPGFGMPRSRRKAEGTTRKKARYPKRGKITDPIRSNRLNRKGMPAPQRAERKTARPAVMPERPFGILEMT